jgi:hypothetical protein
VILRAIERLADFGFGDLGTMSDQEFETSREFEILDFLSSLKAPVLQILPNHFQVLFKYNCQVF